MQDSQFLSLPQRRLITEIFQPNDPKSQLPLGWISFSDGGLIGSFVKRRNKLTKILVGEENGGNRIGCFVGEEGNEQGRKKFWWSE